MIEGPILLDTNVLVYAIDTLATEHQSCARVISGAAAGEFDCVLVPQVLVETFATVTRSDSKKVVRSDQAADYLDGLVERLPVLPVSLDSVLKLTALTRVAKARGQAVYDLFLVAQMQSHGVSRICTYDRGFGGLGVDSITPDQLLSASS